MLSVTCLVIYMYMYIVIISCTDIIHNNSIYIHVHGMNTIHKYMEYKATLHTIQTLLQILGSELDVKNTYL